MPERARPERRHASPEPRFLALGRDPQVDVILQPVVGVLVPAAEVAVRVLRGLETPRVDVLQPVPEYFSRPGIEAVVAHSG